MPHQFEIGSICSVASVVVTVASGTASAVEVTNLAGLEDIYGRYASKLTANVDD